MTVNGFKINGTIIIKNTCSLKQTSHLPLKWLQSWPHAGPWLPRASGGSCSFKDQSLLPRSIIYYQQPGGGALLASLGPWHPACWGAAVRWRWLLIQMPGWCVRSQLCSLLFRFQLCYWNLWSKKEHCHHFSSLRWAVQLPTLMDPFFRRDWGGRTQCERRALHTSPKSSRIAQWSDCPQATGPERVSKGGHLGTANIDWTREQ